MAITEAEREANIIKIRQQANQYMNDRTMVSCGECSKSIVIWRLFKCLYCGVYFCEHCAKVHFGPNEGG